MLIRITNASKVSKEHVHIPYSNLKAAVAKVLHQEGYIAGVDTKNGNLSLKLSYVNKAPKVQGAKRISKPSRRVYMGVRDVRPIKNGYGLMVLSTPAGVLTGKEAKAKRVGGEVLFEIW
jgi:small subunit ribosomal protein S8